jgi:hypothetical protein
LFSGAPNVTQLSVAVAVGKFGTPLVQLWDEPPHGTVLPPESVKVITGACVSVVQV